MWRSLTIVAGSTDMSEDMKKGFWFFGRGLFACCLS